MNIAENSFSESISSHEEVFRQFKETGYPVIREIVEHLSRCFENNGKVLLIGNGGSAADCQHIAGELIGRFRASRDPLPGLSLASDTSVLTCIANDFGYGSVFSRQVLTLGEEQDLLWALSTSGASPNILKAAEAAKEKQMAVISFTGKEESPLEKISDVCLCANTEDTARAQEIHQIAYHIICSYLDDIYPE